MRTLTHTINGLKGIPAASRPAERDRGKGEKKERGGGMSVTVGEVARSSEQFCPLLEPGLQVGRRPASNPLPRQSRAGGLSVRERANLEAREGETVEERDGFVMRELGLEGSSKLGCLLGEEGVQESCHSNGKRSHVGGGTRAKTGVLSGASLLRQQWAAHTQPKLHLSDPPSENEEETAVAGEQCLREQLPPLPHPDKSCPRLDSAVSSSPDTATHTPPSSSRAGRQLLKTHSVGSISSESLTVSSLWEAPSYDTIPDFLSSLGFDDFDSPELIPDRFIPAELDFARPSLMRQATLGSVTGDGLHSDLSPPTDNLLLGATAESVAPDLSATMGEDTEPLLPPQTLALYLPSSSQLPWQPASLETVMEETNGELLSPRPPSRQSSRLTPRLSSPLVSIDHTPTQDLPMGLEGDVSAGLLGAGLRLRQQSLARDDPRGRQMSLGAESDTSSLYFSVGSHFDDGEKEAESGSGGGGGGGGGREAVLAQVSSCGEETDTPSRRRRRGNYVPPPQLLMWLEKSESTEDSLDQPWPFSEKNVDQLSEHRILSDAPPPTPSITLNGNANNNIQSCSHPLIRDKGTSKGQSSVARPQHCSSHQCDTHPPP